MWTVFCNSFFPVCDILLTLLDGGYKIDRPLTIRVPPAGVKSTNTSNVPSVLSTKRSSHIWCTDLMAEMELSRFRAQSVKLRAFQMAAEWRWGRSRGLCDRAEKEKKLTQGRSQCSIWCDRRQDGENSGDQTQKCRGAPVRSREHVGLVLIGMMPCVYHHSDVYIDVHLWLCCF